jgi:hypothetical protein
MNEDQFRYLMQLYNGGGDSSPVAGSYPHFRQGIDPFVSGRPLDPNQLSPNPNIYRSTTEPNVWLDDPSFPAPRPIPVGTPQPVPQVDNPGTFGRITADPPIYNNFERARWGQDEQDIYNRFASRLFKEGLLGGPQQNLPNPNRPSMDFSDPSIEPSPIPVNAAGGNYPHEAMDVPPGTFGPFQDLPVNPYGQPSGIAPNPWDDTVHFDVNAPNPPSNPYAGIYDQMFPNNPAPNEAMTPTPVDTYQDYQPTPDIFSADAVPIDWQNLQQAPDYGATNYPGEDLTAPPAVAPGATDIWGGQANIDWSGGPLNTPYPNDPGNLPTPPGVTPEDLPANPFTELRGSPVFATGQPGQLDTEGNPIAGTALSPQDEANIYNRQGLTPIQPGLLAQLNAPTDWSHAGQLFRDAAGNIVDAAGKVMGTLGDLAKGAGNLGRDFIDNIMNDPRNTTPDYLASLGYTEMNTGESIPGGVSGPTVGAADTGAYGAINSGSYFHGGASAGQPHGATSVAGAFYNLGGSGPVNLGGTSMGNAMNQSYLRKMYKGLYTPAGIYGMNRAQSPSPFSGATSVAPGQTFQQFHQGQVNLGNILRANPSLMAPRVSGRSANINRGTPHTLPV